MKLAQLLACALFICGAYASVPKFGDQYVVRGFYQLPYFNMSEPFEFTFDKTNNRQKWDFYEGLDVTLYFYGQNKVYTIGPNVNRLQCTSTTADQADFPTLTSVFPDLANGWEYGGSKVVRGIPCNYWVNTVTQYNHTDYYYFYVDSTWNTPVQLYMDGINYLFGSHQDIYIFDFISYVPAVTDKAFNVPALCSSKKVQIDAIDDDTETAKTSNVAMRGHYEAIRKGKTFFRGLEELRVKLEFDAFVKLHNRKYIAGEEKKRFSVFKKNFYLIEEHNRKNLSFTLKMNKFGDMTDDEFRSIMLRDKKATKRMFNEKASRVHSAPSSSSAPQAIDWRDYGAVTMVKDQASCGSCWTFGSTGSLEGVVMLQSGKLVSLSEQQLVDCSRDNYGNAGCGGGFASGAYQWIIDNGGIATEGSYPYLGQNSFCNANDKSSGISISGYVNVTSYSEPALQDAVGRVGPVAVAIDASHPTFRFYANGVYFESQCGSGMDSLDHEVLAVGYGSDNGQDYWIVKNSWSTKWGNQGYIWMARNRNNNCGIASQATYPIYP